MKNTKKLLSQSVIAGLTALVLPLAAQAKSDNAQNMHQLYENNCASCHGSDHDRYTFSQP